MNSSPTVTLLCLLVPLLAGADTLDVYGHLTGKTVLRPAVLPLLPDSIVPDSLTDKTKAIATMERALAERGLAVVPDGPHFVRVFHKEARDSLTNAPLRGAELAEANGQEVMPAGTINFIRADLNQVLSIYAALSQRTILRSLFLPASTVSLKSQCALSKDEALYAFATVLSLNGICVVGDGAKFVQVVPMAQRDQIKTNAPKPEPGAKLFDPKGMPSMGVSGFPVPQTERERFEQAFERARKAFYDFTHLPDPQRRPARRLLGLYADLTDKTPVTSTNLDGASIWFHVETPLTKSELLYAIETTFTLHNLAVVPVADGKIRLGHISEVLRDNGGRLERVPAKR
jgi:hypothetical protein